MCKGKHGEHKGWGPGRVKGWKLAELVEAKGQLGTLEADGSREVLCSRGIHRQNNPGGGPKPVTSPCAVPAWLDTCHDSSIAKRRCARFYGRTRRGNVPAVNESPDDSNNVIQKGYVMKDTSLENEQLPVVDQESSDSTRTNRKESATKDTSFSTRFTELRSTLSPYQQLFTPEHPFITDQRARIFLVSFTMLFFELLCILWIPSYVRYLSYFNNFLLMASFLGIGLGMLTARRKRFLFPPFPLLVLAMVIVVAVNKFDFRITSTDVLYFGIADQ